MKARTFIGLMFLLLVFTTCLLVFAAPRQSQAQKTEGRQGSAGTGVQAADVIIWESVSKHLLSAVQ